MSRLSLGPLSDESGRLLALERIILPESDTLRLRAFVLARAFLRRRDAVPLLRFWQKRVPQLVAAALGTLVAVGAFAAWQRYRRSMDEAARGTAPVPVAFEQRASRPTSEAGPAPQESPLTRGQLAPSTESDTEPGTPTEIDGAAAHPASENDAYAAELALLQRARAAVARGDHGDALLAIAGHQQRFAHGRLREEREALRVTALAGLGRKEEALHAAERFRAAFPRSVLASRIEDAIR